MWGYYIYATIYWRQVEEKCLYNALHCIKRYPFAFVDLTSWLCPCPLGHIDFTEPLSIFSSLAWCVLTECVQPNPRRPSAPHSGQADPRLGTQLMSYDMEMFLPVAQQPAGGRKHVATRQNFEATCFLHSPMPKLTSTFLSAAAS